MMTDLRFALRQLLRSPGFTLLAVITLALGIGLNTAIFSLINDLFLRGLPFNEPSRVVHIFAGDKGRELINFPLGAPRFMHYRDGQTIFSSIAAENGIAQTLTGLGDPVQLPVFKATANYFDVLGVQPIRGRNFLPQEEEGAAALALGRLLTSQLYQVSAHNPLLLTGTAVILALAALLACLLPARRASLVNPVEALRAE